VDESEPWWRRRNAAAALVGRIPDGFDAKLLECVKNPKDTAEVRTAVLDVLVTATAKTREALLEWLRGKAKTQALPDGLEEHVLHARARLGDLTATPELTQLAYDDWTDRRQIGEEALAALVEQAGLSEVLRALGQESAEGLATTAVAPADRLFGVRLLIANNKAPCALLADVDRVVARHVHMALVEAETSVEQLWEMARSLEESEETRSWTLLTLHGKGELVKETWERLDEPRVPLSAVPADASEGQTHGGCWRRRSNDRSHNQWKPC
jgi:hypothetical protein